MSESDIQLLLFGAAEEKQQHLSEINRRLEQRSAEERIYWALEHLPGRHILSSSFGIQSAVMLHMMTRILPDLPVMLIDTGYLFSETYNFVDELRERLDLNLKIYSPQLSPAWQEARLGRLWEQGVEGISRYNELNKVQPMRQGLEELEAGTWFSGPRRGQSSSRTAMPVLQIKWERFKVHPIVDWHNRKVHAYLQQHNLPYHPLWEQGYVSVGDVHTTRPLAADMREEDTRFFGLKRECGLHE